jgi:hypothetical protein
VQGSYCIDGALRNSGGQLDEYLVLALVLYDSQDRIINFGDDFISSPGGISGDETAEFEVCVDPPNNDVVRYEMLAWGR